MEKIGDAGTHPHGGAVLSAKAHCCYRKGGRKQAAELFLRSAEITKRFFGENHPSTAKSYNNVGLDCACMRDYARALENYDKARIICTTLFGEDDSRAIEVRKKMEDIQQLVDRS